MFIYTCNSLSPKQQFVPSHKQFEKKSLINIAEANASLHNSLNKTIINKLITVHKVIGRVHFDVSDI